MGEISPFFYFKSKQFSLTPPRRHLIFKVLAFRGFVEE